MTRTLTERAAPRPVTRTARPGAPRPLDAAGYGVLALVAYVPILLTQQGRVAADTKTYLYLDPGRLLARAPSMWDPNIGLGTVTHQNIGYVFPMGPYYWVADALRVPDWVAQRLWLGSILFLAGLGVLYLFRTLHVRGPGTVAGALVFMLAPYTLNFASRLSVILLPWAGLAWMLAFVIRALRDDGWRYPALLAITIQVVGSVNATALVFAGIAPVLWVMYAWFVAREVDARRVVTTVARITLLTVLASLWWIVGLAIQSAYGLDILRFTETLETVAHASVPSEVLRGLGYWFFYGGDKIEPWIEASVRYTQDLWLIAATFAVTGLAFVAAVVVRWRHRVFFVLVLVVGFVIAVGPNPYDDPSLLGRVFTSFAASSSFGLALRSSARALPLVTLGVAVLLGVGVNALAAAWSARGHRLAGLVTAGLVVVLAAAGVPALWDGGVYGRNLLRDERIPDYWTAAAAALDARSHDTRVLEIPGADFASYRWGGTVEPITPGLVERPYVARELVPWGSPATADLLNALDRRLQEGVLDPAAIAPIARLMRVGDVVFRADLQTDRFDLARAAPTWRILTDPRPPGLGPPAAFGRGLGPPLHYEQLDDLSLAGDQVAAEPPPVSVFAVEDPVPIVSAASSMAPLLVSGDGEGLVDLAGLGGLDPRRVVLYAASFAREPRTLRQEVARPGSVLVVTDTNRKRARRWGAIRDVRGPTERVDEAPLVRDERDARLDVFPGAGPDAQTVVDSVGGRVSTTHVGNLVTYWPEMRGARAFDGDLSTAWEVGDNGPVVGERIRIDLDAPVTTDRVNLVQRLLGRTDRFVTRVRLAFDRGDPVTADLHAASRTPEGETVTFPPRTFRRLEITIADTNVGASFEYPASNNVGFAEIRLRDDSPGAQDVRVREIVRMPTDLVDAVGVLAADRPLVYTMTRARTVAVRPRSGQDEWSIVRRLRVPNTRAFTVGGTVRLSPDAPDELVDSALGVPDAGAGGITIRTSGRLPADIGSRGSRALDGDTATAWTTPFGDPVGRWIEVQTPAPVTFDHLDLLVVADGRHSVPTQLRVDAGGESRTVDVPPLEDGTEPATVVRVPVEFPPLTGSTVRVTVTAARAVTTLDYHDLQQVTTPVALAELGVPGVRAASPPAALPDRCRTDLLTIDDAPVPVRVTGDAAAAAAGGAVALEVCDGPLTLEGGDHLVEARPGRETGLDVDGLVLASAGGGGPLPLGARGDLGPALALPDRTRAAPRVEVVDDGRTKLRLRVTGAEPGVPFWLVLGQSNNPGWSATLDSDGSKDPDDGAAPMLVDGYANGWLVVPAATTLDVMLEWMPQRTVWIALAISAAALVACLALVLRRRRREPGVDDDVGRLDPAPALGMPLRSAGRDLALRAAAAAALAAGAASVLVTRWWIGAVVALAVFAAAGRARLRGLLTVGAPLCVLVTAAYVVVQQARYRYPYDFYWVEHFDRVADVAWLAVLLLATDALVETLRDRAAGGTADATDSS